MGQRKVLNYLKTAGLGRGYYLYLFAGSVAFLGIMLTYAAQLLSEVNVLAGQLADAGTAASIQDRVFLVAIIFFVSFATFVTSTAYFMIVLGQRVGGPVVAICAFIEDLKKGNFHARRTLRRKDELVPIMDGLHELADILKKKEPIKNPKPS